MSYTVLNKDLDDILFNSYQDGKNYYVNLPMSFDIETSNIFYNPKMDMCEQFDNRKSSKYYEKCIKIGLCYLWQIQIDDNQFYGRDLESLFEFLTLLDNKCPFAIKILFVHNLSFEFQFLRNILNDMEVFARKKRKPLYAKWNTIEFRCSYMLTRLSLQKWGENLGIEKLVGDLDYEKLRTPFTILTKKEIGYGLRDVEIVVKGIRKYMERYDNKVSKIPLTQTGVVRREYQHRMANNNRYHHKMVKLQPYDIDMYKVFIHTLKGGYTHANYFNANRTCYNVRSKDFTSGYPWAMLLNKYPMTPFEKTTFNSKYIESDKYSIIIRVKMDYIKSRYFNSYLSFSKCMSAGKCMCDNGRIMEGYDIDIYLNNYEYDTLNKAYDIRGLDIIECYVSLNGYLPDELCLYILELLYKKTCLKGADDEMYAKSKEELNALFGMLITKIITDDIEFFNNDWHKIYLTEDRYKQKVDKIKRNISKANTAFQHGIYIPSYTCHELWEAIMHIDADVVYDDTDSIKYIGDHEDYFIKYNNKVRRQQEIVADRLGVDVSRLRPISPKGIVSSIGEFADDGFYQEFKTLGAKKYMYKENYEYHITVSGVRKDAVSQLTSIEQFKDGLIFDIDHAKKLLMHYNDKQPSVVVNKGKYDEYTCNYQYGICGQNTTYELSISGDYKRVLKGDIHLPTSIFME